MHLFQFAFYTTGLLYALISQQFIILYFLLIIILYLILSCIISKSQPLSSIRKFMSCQYNQPTQGIIKIRQTVNVQKILQLQQKIPKQNRPTLTHFVVKAIGQLLNNCPQLNGKIVFGKFVQYKKQNVTCVVNIKDGKDLAFVLVEDVYNKSILQIAEFMKKTASEMKDNDGGSDHKNRMSIVKYIPTFFINISMAISKFIFHHLGLNIKPFNIKQDQFGGACLTSVGMIGFTDATAPHVDLLGTSMTITLNAVHEGICVKNGQPTIGNIVKINFAIDGRLAQLEKIECSFSSFLNVFQKPELYLEINRKTRIIGLNGSLKNIPSDSQKPSQCIQFHQVLVDSN